MAEQRTYFMVYEGFLGDELPYVRKQPFTVTPNRYKAGAGNPVGMHTIYSPREFERSLYRASPRGAIEAWHAHLREQIAQSDQEGVELRRRFGLQVDPTPADGAPKKARKMKGRSA